jgi:hypothetical protein
MPKRYALPAQPPLEPLALLRSLQLRPWPRYRPSPEQSKETQKALPQLLLHTTYA